MKTEDLLKWAAIAVGAWWLYNNQDKLFGGGNGGVVSVAPGNTTQPALPPGTTAPPRGDGQHTGNGGQQTGNGAGSEGGSGGEGDNMSLTPTARQMVQVAGRSSGLNFDQWNYYYQQVSGNRAPGATEAGIERTATMPTLTVGQWSAIVKGKVDLSGMPHLGNLYTALSGNAWTN